MEIDIEKLRNDIKEECEGAFFAGGFGAALLDSYEVEKASAEKLVSMAEQMGINLNEYRKGF